MNDEALTPTEILAELARRRWKKYVFAGLVRVNPRTLADYLAERQQIPAAVEARIRHVFETTRPRR
jgi:plasmid maintenance system antidote protein VapI